MIEGFWRSEMVASKCGYEFVRSNKFRKKSVILFEIWII